MAHLKKACLIILFLINSYQGFAQNICDSTLTPATKSLISYQNRGNRCEGFYDSPVTVPSLDVIGVLKGKFNYDLDSLEVITLSAPNVSFNKLTIRAQAAPSNTFYRLDAELNYGQKLVWPIKDVLLRRTLSSKYISVMAWYKDQDYNVYVPLHVESKINTIKNDDRIRAVFRSTIDIKSTAYLWRSLNLNTKNDWQIIYKETQAGSKIRIPAPVNATGLYYLWVRCYKSFDEKEKPLEQQIFVKITD